MDKPHLVTLFFDLPFHNVSLTVSHVRARKRIHVMPSASLVISKGDTCIYRYQIFINLVNNDFRFMST